MGNGYEDCGAGMASQPTGAEGIKITGGGAGSAGSGKFIVRPSRVRIGAGGSTPPTVYEQLISAQSELAALREDLAESGKADHLRQRISFLTTEIHKQAERLAAAEQRNTEQLKLLHMAKELLSTISLHKTMAPADWCDSFKNEVADRLEKLRYATKPTESGASE